MQSDTLNSTHANESKKFIFENSVTILREPYFLNKYKFVVSALSSLLNGIWATMILQQGKQAK